GLGELCCLCPLALLEDRLDVIGRLARGRVLVDADLQLADLGADEIRIASRLGGLEGVERLAQLSIGEQAERQAKGGLVFRLGSRAPPFLLAIVKSRQFKACPIVRVPPNGARRGALFGDAGVLAGRRGLRDRPAPWLPRPTLLHS